MNNIKEIFLGGAIKSVRSFVNGNSKLDDPQSSQKAYDEILPGNFKNFYDRLTTFEQRYEKGFFNKLFAYILSMREEFDYYGPIFEAVGGEDAGEARYTKAFLWKVAEWLDRNK